MVDAMEKGCVEYGDTPHLSMVTTTLSTEDEQEPVQQYSKGSVRPPQDTEVNDVMECIYRRRLEKEAAERGRTATKRNVKGSISGEKRKRGTDVDVGDEESADEEASDTRTLVYSAEVKDLVCDNDHETIEKSPKIEKIMKDAIRYLTYLPSIHKTWSKKQLS